MSDINIYTVIVYDENTGEVLDGVGFQDYRQACAACNYFKLYYNNEYEDIPINVVIRDVVLTSDNYVDKLTAYEDYLKKLEEQELEEHRQQEYEQIRNLIYEYEAAYGEFSLNDI